MAILLCGLFGIVVVGREGWVGEGVLSRVLTGGFKVGGGGLNGEDLRDLRAVADGMERVRLVEGKLDGVLKRVDFVESGFVDSMSKLDDRLEDHRAELALHFEKLDAIFEAVSASQRASYESVLEQVRDYNRGVMERIVELERGDPHRHGTTEHITPTTARVPNSV